MLSRIAVSPIAALFELPSPFCKFVSSLSRNWLVVSPVIGADKDRQIAGHVTGFDRVDADIL
jgi:hypothetical protein